MLPSLKEPAFVDGPLRAQGLQSVVSRSKISFHVLRLCLCRSRQRLTIRSPSPAQEYTPFPTHKKPPLLAATAYSTNTNAIGACSTRGVFAGSARQFVCCAFRAQPGALRSNTPFKVRRRGHAHHGPAGAVNKTVTLPSTANFLTRGRQPSVGLPFAFVYSRM